MDRASTSNTPRATLRTQRSLNIQHSALSTQHLIMIPSPLLLKLLCVWLLSAIVVSFWPAAEFAWQMGSLFFLLIIIADMWMVYITVPPSVKRSIPGSLPVGIWHDVKLRFSSVNRASIEVEIFDHHPAEVEIRDLPQVIKIPSNGWLEAHYAIRPIKRGELYFAGTDVRLTSPLHLWQKRKKVEAPDTIRVYPNFAAITGYALLATDNRLSQMGILRRQRRGEGLDFHQLREYRQGDSLRSIDWKATARTIKLITREYQDERDQQVMFLIDCGRRMSAQDGELSHFDHALNAVLLLAYVGLRQGDAVGLMTMSGEPRYSAPRKSAATVNVILNTLYDLQPSLMTSDYYRAALELGARLRKRALVVMISNLRDEDDHTLVPALKLLSRKHLVLFASLREKILTEAINHPVEDLDDAITHASAVQYLRMRTASFRRLEHHGALCLDVEPEKLPVMLVNRYLEIKRGGAL